MEVQKKAIVIVEEFTRNIMCKLVLTREACELWEGAKSCGRRHSVVNYVTQNRVLKYCNK